MIKVNSNMRTHVDESGRVCSKCRAYKLWSCFGCSNRHSTGYSAHCKDCQRKKMKAYKVANPEYYRYPDGKYRASKESAAKSRKKRYLKNIDEEKRYKKQWWTKNCEAARAKKRANYRLKSKEILAAERSARQEYPLAVQSERIAKRFGLPDGWYILAMMAQRYKCAICLTEWREGLATLAVDHCHETGLIRGLLCSKCNLGVGHFDDSIDMMSSAIEYLMATHYVEDE